MGVSTVVNACQDAYLIAFLNLAKRLWNSMPKG